MTLAKDRCKAPISDLSMARVYHGLYYARWWVTGQEPLGLLRQAAMAVCATLGQSAAVAEADVFLRVARLWLELGEIEQPAGWLSLAEWAANHGETMPSDFPLIELLVNSKLTGQSTPVDPCLALDGLIATASAWGQPAAGTFWNALQLANIRHRFCGQKADLPGLLTQIT